MKLWNIPTLKKDNDRPMKYTQDSETRLQLPLSIDQSTDIVTTRGRIGFISGGGRGEGVAHAFGHEPLPPLSSFPFTTLWLGTVS